MKNSNWQYLQIPTSSFEILYTVVVNWLTLRARRVVALKSITITSHFKALSLAYMRKGTFLLCERQRVTTHSTYINIIWNYKTQLSEWYRYQNTSNLQTYQLGYMELNWKHFCPKKQRNYHLLLYPAYFKSFINWEPGEGLLWSPHNKWQ